MGQVLASHGAEHEGTEDQRGKSGYLRQCGLTAELGSSTCTPIPKTVFPPPHVVFNLGDHSDLTKEAGAVHQPEPARTREVWPH